MIRTTNLLERLFLEEPRRTKIIPHAFGERPVLKLMYAAVIRAAERWRGITIGEFEQRQLKAIRDELNRAHAQRVAPAVARPTPSAPKTADVTMPTSDHDRAVASESTVSGRAAISVGAENGERHKTSMSSILRRALRTRRG